MYSLKTSERVLYGDTYLVISLEGKSLIPYQEDMLYENRLPGYLGFYSKFEDETLIFYNITNCVSLSDFIGNRKLTRKQYLTIADAIIDAMILRDQYFLSENSLLIHQNFIYIKDNSEIVLVYLPSAVDTDSKQALRDFVAWLTSKLDISEPGAGDAPIPLQLILGSPSFNLKVVKETIAQILSGSPHEPVPKAYASQNTNQKIQSIDTVSQHQNNRAKSSKNKKEPNPNLFGIGEKKKKPNVKSSKTKKIPKKHPPRDEYGNAAYVIKQPDEEYNTEELQRYIIPDTHMRSSFTDLPKGYGQGISEDVQLLVYLLYKPNTSEERIVHVDKSPYVIGRSENSDFIINDISISREHAKMILENNKVYLIDTKSKYGTYINDLRIQPDSAIELKDDDSIMLSGLIFTVKLVKMDDIYALPR